MLVAVLLEHDLEHLLARLDAAALAVRGAFGEVDADGFACIFQAGGFGSGLAPARVLGGGLNDGVGRVDEPNARLVGLLAAGVGADEGVAAVHAVAEVVVEHFWWS